jgi:hypothetical protein
MRPLGHDYTEDTGGSRLSRKMRWGVVWWRLPHLTTYDISKIDAAVRAVLTEIGGGAEMTRKAMLRSHRYCWGRTHVNPWVTNV